MSYILDALRKADAQRERDPARGIHAQALPQAGASATRRFAPGLPLWVGGGLALVAVLLAAGWFVSRGGPVQSAQGVVTLPAASATAAPAAVANLAPAALPQPAPANPIPPGQPAVRGLAPHVQQAQYDPSMGGPRTARGAAAAGADRGTPSTPPLPAPVAPAAPGAMPPPAAAVPPPAPSVVPPAPAAVPVANTSAAPPAQATTGLPVDAPKIAISGGVYSVSPTQRMLIVNGQVFNEGSEVAPGVTVEEIKARTAVLKFRGTRYTVAY